MAARRKVALPSRAASNIRCANSMVSEGSSDTVGVSVLCQWRLEAANECYNNGHSRWPPLTMVVAY